MNRVEPIINQFTRGARYNMQLLLSYLTPSEIVPDVDKYYTFVYTAKTPNLEYDQHPVIICTSVHKWGFIGFNYHWNDYRQYSWGDVLSNIYEIYPDEIEMVKGIQLALFKRT